MPSKPPAEDGHNDTVGQPHDDHLEGPVAEAEAEAEAAEISDSAEPLGTTGKPSTAGRRS